MFHLRLLLCISLCTANLSSHGYFRHRLLRTSKQAIAALRTVLGRSHANFTPKITQYTDCQTTIINNRPTLFLHGYRSHGKQVETFYKDQLIAGPSISFNFPDTIAPGKAVLAKTNFAQDHDILTALWVLHQCKQTKLFTDAIDLWGYSRGGATIGTMIHALAEPTPGQKTKLEQLGIDAKERSELLAAIQKGNIVLDRPLIVLRSALKSIIQHQLPSWMHTENKVAQAILSAIISGIATTTDYSLPLATRFHYWPNGPSFLHALNTLQQLKLNILLHVQQGDTVVSNELDMQIYNLLHQSNPEHTYLVIGNNGGHRCHATDLIPYAHAFKRKYGGSYNFDCIDMRADLPSGIYIH